MNGRTVTTRTGQRFGRDGELVVLGLSRSGSHTAITVQAGSGTPFAVRTGQTRQVP